MKRSKLNKQSKQRTPVLKRKLWKLFSKFIRKRDNGICQSCGRICEGQGYHAGHLIPKSICGKALEFSEENVFGQCYFCNINLGGNQAILALQLKRKFGYDLVEKLNRIRLETKGDQWTTNELEKLIEKYTEV